MSARPCWFVAAMGLWLSPQTVRAAHAQQPASIIERVIGPDSTPLAGAKVELLTVGALKTDSTGVARFNGLPAGTFVLHTTMLGYRPVLKMLNIAGDSVLTVTVILLRAVALLDSVIVRADSSSTPLSDPTGFDQRRRNANGGHYVVAEEIARTHNADTEQLFHGIPSVVVDTAGIIVVKRGVTSLRDIYNPGGSQFTKCVGAQVIINGIMMPQPFNINDVPIGSIRGIEIYDGPATTPVALRSRKTVCGTVAVWLK